jgi:PhnB protein
MVKAVPDGYHNVTPYLVVSDAAKLLDFVTKAFGAKEKMRMPGPDGRIAHAEVVIGDSVIMMGSPAQPDALMPGMIYLYVEDTDATYKRALSAGASSVEEPNDAFYGDRRAAVKDATGNQWFIATAQKQVSPEEMKRRMAAMQTPAG